MRAKGFQFPIPSVASSGGLYHVSPHYWEVRSWLGFDLASSDEAGGDQAMDRYIGSLSPKRQADFSEAVDSGPLISIDVFGLKTTESSAGGRAVAERPLWGDRKARMRAETIISNARAQAEQRVGQDPKFLVSAARFKRCATQAGMADVLYEEGALHITSALGPSAREVALRCDAESSLTKVGQARFRVAEASFATYYEQDFRSYLATLATANAAALTVIGGS